MTIITMMSVSMFGRRYWSHLTLNLKGALPMMDLLSQTPVMIGMGVLLVALIGLLIFLQMRGKKD